MATTDYSEDDQALMRDLVSAGRFPTIEALLEKGPDYVHGILGELRWIRAKIAESDRKGGEFTAEEVMENVRRHLEKRAQERKRAA